MNIPIERALGMLAALGLAAWAAAWAGKAAAGSAPAVRVAGGLPYGGTPARIPGKIEAENYDLGGEGVAYHDVSPGNTGGFYRVDDVDIKFSTDTGGGYAIGWFNAGEWLDYTVDVTVTALYDIDLRVGSYLPGRTLTIAFNGTNVTGEVAVPQVEDWDRYERVRIRRVPLTAGLQVMRVQVGPLDYLDLNWISFRVHQVGTLLRISGHEG
jgi:hypothetical protein